MTDGWWSDLPAKSKALVVVTPIFLLLLVLSAIRLLAGSTKV
jgi:hypothetical protein